MTRAANLAVNSNVTVTEMAGQEVCLGESARFTTTATGTGPYTFVWKHGPTEVISGGEYAINSIAGVSTLTVADVNAADSGLYSVTVYGPGGPSATASASLALKKDTGAAALSDAKVCAGGNATFTTIAGGGAVRYHLALWFH